MSRLALFACENFYPEFRAIIEQEGFDDVVVKPYSCICENKKKIGDTAKLLKDSEAGGDDIVVLCGNQCEVLKLISGSKSIQVRKTSYCLGHLAGEGFITYIVGKGGYVVALGWLNDWKKRIECQGFDRPTARRFYKEFCRELVFFDAGIDTQAESKLRELADYLGLPYIVIPTDLELVRYLIKSVVYEFRLQKKSDMYGLALAKAQAQCAEYSAIFDMLGRLSSYRDKRDAIEKIRELFTIVLGAQDFFYRSADTPEGITTVSEITARRQGVAYKLFSAENKFSIKISHNDKDFGSIHVGNFLFPQHIDRYLNFALEVARICGLVLSNIEQYEAIVKSESKFEYLSLHDALTGVYNRTYVNSLLDSTNLGSSLAVFSFDIDKLKFVNDTYGHMEGDKLIRSASEILKSCFREVDTFARMGGDEFIAILPECTEPMAQNIKSRVEEAISQHNARLLEPHLALSISTGYAVSKNKQCTIESLLQEADRLMYVAKMNKKS